MLGGLLCGGVLLTHSPQRCSRFSFLFGHGILLSIFHSSDTKWYLSHDPTIPTTLTNVILRVPTWGSIPSSFTAKRFALGSCPATFLGRNLLQIYLLIVR